MIKAKASLALRLTAVGLTLLLAGCLRSGTPVVAPSAAAIEQAKALGGSAIDPTHRDAPELLAIETGIAELPGGPGAIDEPGTHAPPGGLTTGSTGKRVAEVRPRETIKPAPNTKAIKAVAVTHVACVEDDKFPARFLGVR